MKQVLVAARFFQQNWFHWVIAGTISIATVLVFSPWSSRAQAQTEPLLVRIQIEDDFLWGNAIRPGHAYLALKVEASDVVQLVHAPNCTADH